MRNLAEVKREKVEFLAPLRADNKHEAMTLAEKMISEAKACGLSMRDYLTLKINVAASNDNGQFSAGNRLLNGYEAALKVLNLPVRDDLESGVMLQAAANTFQTFPGTRILFPEVVDDVARFNYRQTPFERVEPMIASRRTISGNELLATVVNDDGTEYRKARAVSEGGRIPIYTIRSSEQSVKIYKFGIGWKTSYEFERRASLDILTPYANRTTREIEMSKVGEVTRILVNGDGAYGAAPEVNQDSFDSVAGVSSTDGVLNYRCLLAWLVSRAKAGVPIDTVVGNWDVYLQWLLMFAVPSSSPDAKTDAENLAKAGFQVRGVPILTGSVDFVLSSSAAANKLIGYSRGDTVEELNETGSNIAESERSIQTQEVTYVRSENSGYRLVFGDTRSVYDIASA